MQMVAQKQVTSSFQICLYAVGMDASGFYEAKSTYVSLRVLRNKFYRFFLRRGVFNEAQFYAILFTNFLLSRLFYSARLVKVF